MCFLLLLLFISGFYIVSRSKKASTIRLAEAPLSDEPLIWSWSRFRPSFLLFIVLVADCICRVFFVKYRRFRLLKSFEFSNLTIDDYLCFCIL
ncbi:hypothetical protein Hanom_Chr07g00634951 [Helianthus anomalus]